MPKKKKTRKQKQLADVRRQTEILTPHTATVETHKPIREEHDTAPAPQAPRPQKYTATHAIATTDYRYLYSDLRKTILLTVAILAIELVLKLFAGL